MTRRHHTTRWQQPTLPDIEPGGDGTGEWVWAVDDATGDVIPRCSDAPTAPNPPEGDTP